MKRLTAIIATLGFIVVCAAPHAHAITLVDCSSLPKDQQEQCALVADDQLNYKSDKNIIWRVVQFLFMTLGGIAVIMIIVGGIQYATSQGESGTLQKAKNTILYSVIGLVVAVFATGIVTFIIDNVAK